MKEEFLHFLWQQKLFLNKSLKTSQGDFLEIIKVGRLNDNSGPDFLNAHIRLNNQIWVGNVEMHLKSSDWYAHHHEKDSNYDAVILHVVWEDDAVIFMKNEQALPTLVLKSVVNKNILANYQRLLLKGEKWIFCEKQIHTVDSFVFSNWLERLYFERLEAKALLIEKLLCDSHNDYEAVLFILLAKNFGLSVNRDAFLKLAKSFAYSIFRKVQSNEFQLAALLFGQAGFLNEEKEEVYFISLKKEYEYLQHKFKLFPLHKREFQFFRMRPANFPTIRIAQMVALFSKYSALFSRLLAIEKVNDFYELFSVEVSDFWKHHYTFDTESKYSRKPITKSFIDLVIINTIIPMKFVYLKANGMEIENKLLDILMQLNPEKNALISKFSSLKIPAKNALDSQALLQLKNEYCANAKCLQCVVGNCLLRR